MIASVRGIGVAVITSTSGGDLLAAGKLRALEHAELVLLVDDHQPQPGQRLLFVKQRVRADDDVRLARRGESRWRREKRG